MRGSSIDQIVHFVTVFSPEMKINIQVVYAMQTDFEIRGTSSLPVYIQKI